MPRPSVIRPHRHVHSGSESSSGQSTSAIEMKQRFAALFAFIFTGSFFAFAQTVSPDRVDDYVRSEMADQHIPGIALGVYEDGQIIKAQGYGLANVELNVGVKPETMFQSGSIGKQFTATAVMMLVEESKINLDDSITKYFPDAPASWQNIAVRNLLSHTSGLAEYESDENTKPGGPINLRADYTEDQLVKIDESLHVIWMTSLQWSCSQISIPVTLPQPELLTKLRVFTTPNWLLRDPLKTRNQE